MKYVLIIPARYKSSRFPGKPLAKIKGKYLIQRVWERCINSFPKNDVYVATDDDSIKRVCEDLGANVVMTPFDCLTGTDRLYEASKKIDADMYINVQGDEPLINSEDIQKVIEVSKENPDKVINAMCSINSEEEFRLDSIPKVVTNLKNEMMYMSRGAIPTTKSLEFVKAYKQVCIMIYPKKMLKVFSERKEKTPIESLEDLELLRFLELGYKVQMVEVSTSSIAVDYPEDIQKVEKELERRNED